MDWGEFEMNWKTIEKWIGKRFKKRTGKRISLSSTLVKAWMVIPVILTPALSQAKASSVSPWVGTSSGLPGVDLQTKNLPSKSTLPNPTTVTSMSPWAIPTILPTSTLKDLLPGLKKQETLWLPKSLFSTPAVESKPGVQGEMGSTLRLKLPLGKLGLVDLELQPTSVRSPRYRLVVGTENGLEIHTPGKEGLYQGRALGENGGKVRISLRPDGMHGMIRMGGKAYFVEPLSAMASKPGLMPHALYQAEDIVEGHAQCGWTPDKDSPASAQALPIPKISAEGDPEPCAEIEIGMVTDKTMFTRHGSVAAVEKRLTDIVHLVDGFYQDPRINIYVRISEMYVETVRDTAWGPMDIQSYLPRVAPWDYGSQGFKNPFDIASFWYNHPGSGTVGLAWGGGGVNSGVICNRQRSAHVVREFTTSLFSLALDMTHELGHNFGAPHVSNDPTSILYPSITGSNDQWDAQTIAVIVQQKTRVTCMAGCKIPPVAAFSESGASPCSDTRSFADASTGEPATWQWDFGDGTKSAERKPVHKYSTAGEYNVSLKVTNQHGTDSVRKEGLMVRPFAAPTPHRALGCAPASVNLGAEGVGTLQWYESALGGAPLAFGPTFVTPSLTVTDTFFVAAGDAAPVSAKVGPMDRSLGQGGFFRSNDQRRLFFDVHNPVVLKSAKVFAETAGPRTVEILDNLKQPILSKTVNLPVGESRMNLDFALEPGFRYAIKLTGGADGLGLYRNSSGADYPYSAAGLMTITDSDATAADSVTQLGYYYFFYDWEVAAQPCGSVRVPVVVTMDCAQSVRPISEQNMWPIQVGRFQYRLPISTGTWTATVFSLDGTGVMARSGNSEAALLDLSPLSSGIYSVELRDASGSRRFKLNR
jgi:PKD repeat protein